MPEGSVLDVSLLENNGTGMKIISRPPNNDRVRHGISDLRIVSSNEVPFERALDALGFSDRKGEWILTKNLVNVRTPKRHSPKKIKSIDDE